MPILLSSSYSHCLLRHASVLLNINLQVSHWIYFRSGQNKGGGWVFWVLSNLNSKQEIFIYVFCKKTNINMLLESSQSSNINHVRTRASEKPWIRQYDSGSQSWKGVNPWNLKKYISLGLFLQTKIYIFLVLCLAFMNKHILW